MAEHADGGFLLYLLDMAILEANRRTRSLAENRASVGSNSWRAATVSCGTTR